MSKATGAFIVVILALAGSAPSAVGQTGKLTADGQPDIQGVWSNASIIPLERPKELEGKQSFTPEEFKQYEERVFVRTTRDRPPAPGAVGTYNDFWWDRDARRAVNLHTSLIVDPPDGKVPPYTPEAQKRIDAERVYSRQHPADGPEDRIPAERCLVFPMGGPPMLPSFYNNSQYGPLTTNYRIVQTPGYVVILMEIIHDARVIPIDGRPHLPSTVRQWLGDSRGHWEGNTLVVETTNFTDEGRGSTFEYATKNMRLVERFTRISDRTIDYQFTVSDPDTWTRPWTAKLPWNRIDGLIYEYACHEGNYGMEHMLSAARAADAKSK